MLSKKVRIFDMLRENQQNGGVMMNVEEALRERKKKLAAVKTKVERELKKLPEGSVNICRANGKDRYYIFNTDSGKWKYLKNKDKALAEALAQKKYDKKLVSLIEQETEAINRYLKAVPEILPEQLYEHLSSGRRKLVTPIRETDEAFVLKWKSQEYKGNAYPFEQDQLVTKLGEHVRSKSELIIADILP